MIVVRSSRPKYRDKLDGEGAIKRGGRWNLQGIAVIYTADSEQTIREELKGRDFDPIKAGYMFFKIEVSDELPILEITREMLEGTNWDLDNYESEDCPTQQIGSEFLESNEYGIIKVPSARSEGDNYLLNPNYPDFESFINVLPEDKPFSW